MGSGLDSTLVLRPSGLTAITFDLDADSMASNSYVVNLDTLRLGEEAREAQEYAQRVGAEGGSRVGVQNPLTPLSFEVVVVAATRTDLIEMVHDLRVALDAGGYLEYKPEDLMVETSSSYYAYLPSGPFGLVKVTKNRWDSHELPEAGTDVYRVRYSVQLMTYPLLLSDPDNPVEVVSATTIQNRDDATGDNFVTIPAVALVGDSRSLLQITMRNEETGDYDDILNVYIFPRVWGLDNYKVVFEPGTIVVGATEWATINDPGQASGGSYQRLTPSSDDLAYRLQFQVTNWTDFIGRHLLLIACRDNGGAEGDFEVRGGWSLGTGELKDPTPWKTTRGEWLGEWQLFSLGEIEFPGTTIVEPEEANTIPYYELEVRRVSGGTGTFDVDFFAPCPVDLRPSFVDCSDVLFLNDHRLLVSNLEYPSQVAHIVDEATLALIDPVRLIGLYPLAECGKAAPDGYRLYFFWERRDGTLLVDDDFSGYDANWQEISDCDVAWVNAVTSDQRMEGAKSNVLVGPPATCDRTIGPVDYSGWANDDYFCMVALHTGVGYNTDVELRDGANIYALTVAIPAGWGAIFDTKGNFFVKAGAPNWNSIDTAHILVTSVITYWDNWRWSAKDPDAAQPNDFGSDWNYQPTTHPWFVFTDAATRCAGNPCVVLASGAEQSLVANIANVANVKMKARVYCFQDTSYTDTEAGLLFRLSDQTSGSEDGYLLEIAEDDDELRLYEYTAGAATLLASVGFTVAAATWYWLGVEVYESTIKCYAHTTEANLWDTPLLEVTDTTHATGKCGFMTKLGMARFDDAEVWAEDDRYNPQDEMEVEVKALRRSVHPHAYCWPPFVEFDGADTSIEVSDDAAIQDLHDGAMTVEAWVRANGWGESNTGMIVAKNGVADTGWRLLMSNAVGLRAVIDCATTDGIADSGNTIFTPDGEWHHVAFTWDDATYNYPRLWIDGVEQTNSTTTRNGAIVSDVGNDLYIGNAQPGTNTFDGDIAQARISDIVRYTDTFDPPPRCTLMEIDADTVGQWIGAEQWGTKIDNQEGDADLDGVLSDGAFDCDCEGS